MPTSLTERWLRVNGIELFAADAGEGPPVVLCHGFPELGYSWRHQIPALAAAGYRVLVPDMRGYGRSSQPADVAAYSVDHLIGDLLGLLDEAGEERAVFVGHDWGSEVVWNMSVLAPERMVAVAGLSVPFRPRHEVKPTELWRGMFGDGFFYILYFQEPGVADAELARDPDTTMRKFLCGATVRRSEGDAGDGVAEAMSRMAAPGAAGLLERMPQPPGRPDWLTAADLGRYVEEFTRTGFTGGLNWYRNFDRNWELLEPVADRRVEMPACFITGDNDVGALMPMPGPEWVSDLRANVTLEATGHWVQQERPEDVNRILIEFLSTVDRKAGGWR